MLGKIKVDTEELLKLSFENYYLLSSSARKGIIDGACSPSLGHSEFPPMALVAGVHLFEAMRDVFHPSDVEWLGDRFRIAAKGRWSRLASLCDDGTQQVSRGSRRHAQLRALKPCCRFVRPPPDLRLGTVNKGGAAWSLF